MRLFYLILALALIAAVVAPFYMKGPTGQPLMRVSDVIDDSLPAQETTVYRWQDAEGIWQYGDTPPEHVDAEPVEVSPNITPIKTDWAAEWAARHPEEQAVDNGTMAPGTATVGDIGDIYDGKAMQKAEHAAELMEQRIHELKNVMEDIAGNR